MSGFLLDEYPSGSTIYGLFHSFDSNGASITLTGLAVTDVEIYKNGSVTQRASDAGYALLDTDGIDFDAVTGIHGISIDLADNTDAGFFAVGSYYTVVLASVTIDTRTVNLVLGSFRIKAAEHTAGFPVSTIKDGTGTGEIDTTSGGVLVAAIAANAITASAIADNAIDAGALAADCITAAKIADGAIDAATFAAGAINAAAIAADAITDAKVASDVTIASVTGAVGSVTGAVGSVTGAVGSVTGAVGSIAAGGISASSFAAGAIDAAAIAANAIGASELAADAVTEIQAGLSTLDAAGIRTAVGLASADLDTQLTACKGTTQITESYAANGVAPTRDQAMLALHQMLMQFAISGTSLTVKKLDNSTTAFVVTLDSATTPTSAART